MTWRATSARPYIKVWCLDDSGPHDAAAGAWQPLPPGSVVGRRKLKRAVDSRVGSAWCQRLKRNCRNCFQVLLSISTCASTPW
jgi:hypothetical protein